MISKILHKTGDYYILNKNAIKKYGLENIIVLNELHENTPKKYQDVTEFCKQSVNLISENTTLSHKNVKQSINRLYKLKFIDVIVKNNEKDVYVKILYDNIITAFYSDLNIKQTKQIKQKKPKIIKSLKKFKKPSSKEVNKYFKELGDLFDNSSIFYDYYESNGWKVGRNSMKCWKSASRNWLKRNQSINFPDFYDKNFESKIQNDQTNLTKYHKHLELLGWSKTYSPAAGTTWKKK